MPKDSQNDIIKAAKITIGDADMDRKILSLVGPLDDDDLQYVDAYVGCELGIFIPSVGHCGYAIREGHTHPSFSFALFPDPKTEFLFGGAHPPGPDEYLAAALSPEIPHQEPVDEEFVSYLAIMVSATLCERLAAEMTVPHCGSWQPFFVPKSAMPLLQAFMSETKQDSGILLQSLEMAVAATLMRCLTGTGAQKGTPAAHSSDIQAAIDYIHQHYATKITTDVLARCAAMSPGSFSRAFRRKTGCSPMQHLIRVRLEKARKLLADTGLTVTETALRCGFHSLSHLTACFRKHYGITPTAFRERRNL